MFRIEYFYHSLDELNTEFTEVYLLGKPPYSYVCNKCLAKDTPCVLYSVVEAFGRVYKSVFCENCARDHIVKNWMRTVKVGEMNGNA